MKVSFKNEVTITIKHTRLHAVFCDQFGRNPSYPAAVLMETDEQAWLEGALAQEGVSIPLEGAANINLEKE